MTAEELLEDIRNLLEQQLKRMEKGSRPAGPKAPQGVSVGGSSGGEGIGSLLSTVTGAVSKFAGVLGAVVSAALAFVALPPLMTAAVLPFVSALNPGIVQQFHHVLDNLQATIGYAFEPIIAQATLTLREWASMLMPVVRELRPVMASLAHTVSDTVIAGFSALMSFVKALIAAGKPLQLALHQMVRLVSQVVDAWAVFSDVLVQMAIEWVSAALGAGTLTDAMDWLKTTVMKCVQAVTVLTIALMKAAGMSEAIARFRTALAKRIEERRNPTGGLVAAPKDVSTSGAEDIARRMAERAFAAVSGAGAARTDTELLEGILKAVEEGASMDLLKTIRDGVAAGMRDARDALIPGGPTGTAAAVVGTVGDVSARAVLPAVSSPIFDLARRFF